MKKTPNPNDGEPREPSADEKKRPWFKRLLGEEEPEPESEQTKPESRLFSRRSPAMPDESQLEEKHRQEALAHLQAEIASARERVTQLEASLRQTEQDLLRYHTICRRCTQPLQMVFGFCDRAAGEPADAMGLAQEFQTIYLSPLVAALKNSGVLVQSTPQGVRLTLPAMQEETQRQAQDGSDGEEFLKRKQQGAQPQRSQLDELLEREQALRGRIEQLQNIYGPYRQICQTCREPLEALLSFSLRAMPEQTDASMDRQSLRLAADALEGALATVGITLKRYEDIADNPEERGKFSIVEHGYVYPAVLWRGDFFFEAVGQTTADRAQSANQL